MCHLQQHPLLPSHQAALDGLPEPRGGPDGDHDPARHTEPPRGPHGDATGLDSAHRQHRLDASVSVWGGDRKAYGDVGHWEMAFAAEEGQPRLQAG